MPEFDMQNPDPPSERFPIPDPSEEMEMQSTCAEFFPIWKCNLIFGGFI